MLRECIGDEGAFDAHPTLGEGSRRSFVLRASEMTVERIEEHPDALRVLFVLPKGGYATTLLSEAVSLNERTVMR